MVLLQNIIESLLGETDKSNSDKLTTELNGRLIMREENNDDGRMVITNNQIRKKLLKLSTPILIYGFLVEVENFSRTALLARTGNTFSNGYLRPMLVFTLFSALHSLEVLEHFLNNDEARNSPLRSGAFFRASLSYGTCIAFINIALQWIYGPILEISGVGVDQTSVVNRYLRVFSLSMLPSIWLKSQLQFYTSEKSSKSPYHMVPLKVFSTGVSFISIYLLYRFEIEPVYSLALAPVISAWAALLVSTVNIAMHGRFKPYQLFKPNETASEHLALVRRIFKVACPRYIEVAGMLSSDLVLSYLMGKKGENQLSTYVIANEYMGFLLYPIFCLGTSSAVYIARQPSLALARRYGNQALIIGGIFTFITTAIVMLLYNHMITLLNGEDSSSIITEGKGIFLLVVASTIPDVFRKLSGSNLRGLNSTLPMMAISLIGAWVISVGGCAAIYALKGTAELMCVAMLANFVFSGWGVTAYWLEVTSPKKGCLSMLFSKPLDNSAETVASDDSDQHQLLEDSNDLSQSQ